MAFLLIRRTSGGDDQWVVAIDRAKPLFLGRIQACDIYLQSPAVSRQHAVLIEKNGICGIKDLGSSNGTFVNGTRIEGSRRLHFGDVVQIGEFTLSYMPDDSDPTAAIKTPATQAAADAKGSPPGRRASTRLARQQRKTSRVRERRSESTRTKKTGSARFNNDLPAPQPPAAIKGDSSPASDAPPAPPAPSGIPPSLPPAALPLEPAPAGGGEEHGLGVRPAAKDTPDPTPPPPRRGTIDENPAPAKHFFADNIAAEPGVGDAPEEPLFDEEPIESRGAPEEADKSASAAQKAAAEAGLVGEFSPDIEEEPVRQEEKYEDTLIRMPISEALRMAIETRLSLYSFLADLAQERQQFLARAPGMAEAVKNELARQDRELLKMPGAKQALAMLEKREARRKDLADKIAEANSNNTVPPPRPSKEMVEAEELAESQWRFIIQSEEEALPSVIEAAYEIMRDEPLPAALAGTGVDCNTLLGGAAYYLALEIMLGEAQKDRTETKTRLAQASARLEKRGRLRLFRRDGGDEDEDEDDEEDGEARAPASADAAALAEKEQALANRVAAITQEMAELEKRLIAEYWRVYTEIALRFIPVADTMNWSIRAFLRHGAVGFQPWWMHDDIKQHLIWECTTDVRSAEVRAKAETDLVFADEYLAAVAGLECTPALDENLELNERNSPNWKADKTLRRMIFSRRQEMLLSGMLGTLENSLAALAEEHAGFDEQIKKVLPGSRNDKQIRRDLQQKQQGIKVEMAKVSKVRDKIRDETLANLRETAAESAARFDSGLLPRPTVDFLIRRECDALHRISRLLANLKERFLPLVVRDYKLHTDAMNDRLAINGEIANMERRDPAVFLETIVPAKKQKDRVDLRISPTIVIVPSSGLLCYAWNPRAGQENGRLAIPACFIRQRLRERQITYLFSDFRWDTSKASAGMDVLTSDTIVAAFMTVRWDWRKRAREAREKGLIFTEQNDRTNWRRVYEAYIQTALDGGKKLYNRNYDFYEKIIGKYFYLPPGVPLLKK